MYNKILSFIKEQGHEIDDNIKFYAERIAECTAAKNKTEIDSILNWLEKKREEYSVNTEEVGINKLDRWHADSETGVISHDTGRFFSIIGIKVLGAKGREVNSWTQPMIKQHECGILGILCKKINGIRHYLLYAKYEPGNMRKLQLSPTLQATDSNLKLAHGGKKPLFAEYFENESKGKVLASVVSVEDGGRFYLKTNRNMIVEVDENEELNIPEDFIWLTLPQLRNLLKRDCDVNSLARSILGSW